MNTPERAIEAISDSRAARAYLDGEDLEVIGRAILEAAAPYLYAQALDDFADHLAKGLEGARNGGERHLYDDALMMLDAYRDPHE